MAINGERYFFLSIKLEKAFSRYYRSPCVAINSNIYYILHCLWVGPSVGGGKTTLKTIEDSRRWVKLLKMKQKTFKSHKNSLIPLS